MDEQNKYILLLGILCAFFSVMLVTLVHRAYIADMNFSSTETINMDN